ncbi:Major Facilitator Superfamily protein [Streptomyces sp. TverLS-915]|uniref:MFS transporter n=1 Tax=Streptomyces sp. TverLS-915 TaxID=1839763 RepID=UPI00081DC5B3|nr:MFS transporter [Streptomyces sp. TverLS-915]SCE05283.1 Major Facilitator Superfamily protein [Streptomyces sp. TverLS-915]
MPHHAPPEDLSRTPLRPARMRPDTVLWVTLAVFAQESVWNFYDAQVPAQLRQYLTSAGLIGLIMGLDNVLGVLIQPWTGFLSDRRARQGRSRWGIILAGAALASVPFALIPWAGGLPALMLCVIAFAATANAFKGVTETLVSDYVSPVHRGRAQGFVKAGVGLTIVVSSLISLLVVDRSIGLAFAIPPALLLVLLLTSWTFLRHRPTGGGASDEATGPEGDEGARTPPDGPALTPPDGAAGTGPDGAARAGRAHGAVAGRDEGAVLASPWAVVRDLVRDPSRARVLLMLGIFCFAGMWSALRTLLTPYGTETLGLSRGAAGGLALPGAIVFLVCVIPLAYLSSRLGQVRAIRHGVALFVAGLLVGAAVPTVPGTVTALVLASAGYATFAVNALVVLWDLAPSRHVVGTYTGLYTVASSAGAALGPALLGLVVDATGWRFMFLDGAAFAAVTYLVFTLLARRVTPART